MSKKNISNLRERIELFLHNSNLGEEQKKEFVSIIEHTGNFRIDALILEEKTFKDYVEELIIFKFLFHKVKDGSAEEKIKEFIKDFFHLLFPEIDQNNIQIKVRMLAMNQIEVIELNELTASLFNTIISTNILK